MKLKVNNKEISCIEDLREIFNQMFYDEIAFGESQIHIEYNTDTSAGHPVRDDDIVRYSLETRRVNDKEH